MTCDVRETRCNKAMNRSTTWKGREPAFIEPMQCKPVAALPVGDTWTFEIKLDGYRCIGVKRARQVTLFSRHKKVLTGRFPGVVEALASLEGDFVLDGELVALDSQGRPSFQLLQNSLSEDLPIYCYVFGLMNRNGELLVNFASFRPPRGVKTCAKPKDLLRLSPLLQAPSD